MLYHVNLYQKLLKSKSFYPISTSSWKETLSTLYWWIYLKSPVSLDFCIIFILYNKILLNSGIVLKGAFNPKLFNNLLAYFNHTLHITIKVLFVLYLSSSYLDFHFLYLLYTSNNTIALFFTQRWSFSINHLVLLWR